MKKDAPIQTDRGKILFIQKIVFKLNNIFIGKSWLDSPRGEGIIPDAELMSLLAELKPYPISIAALSKYWKLCTVVFMALVLESVRIFESKSLNT